MLAPKFAHLPALEDFDDFTQAEVQIRISTLRGELATHKLECEQISEQIRFCECQLDETWEVCLPWITDGNKIYRELFWKFENMPCVSIYRAAGDLSFFERLEISTFKQFGVPVALIAKKYNVSDSTVYRYGDLVSGLNKYASRQTS